MSFTHGGAIGLVRFVRAVVVSVALPENGDAGSVVMASKGVGPALLFAIELVLTVRAVAVSVALKVFLDAFVVLCAEESFVSGQTLHCLGAIREL